MNFQNFYLIAPAGVTEEPPTERSSCLQCLDATIHKAAGRLNEDCSTKGIYFTLPHTERGLTIGELRSKRDAVARSIEPVDALEQYHKLSRRESKVRKTPIVSIALKKILLHRLKDNKGEWMKIDFADLANTMGKSTKTIARAMAEIGEEDRELVFFTAFPGMGKRGPRKFVALRAWLKYDEQPLHYRADGSDRRVRPSLRREDGVTVHAVTTPKTPPAAVVDRPRKPSPSTSTILANSSVRTVLTNRQNFLPHPIGPSFYKEGQQSSTPAEAKASETSKQHAKMRFEDLRKLSLYLARRCKALEWEKCRISVSLWPLAAEIEKLIRRGHWRNDILQCYKMAIREAHSAAEDTAAAKRAGDSRGLRVANPNGLAMTVFRREMAKRPKLLAEQIYALLDDLPTEAARPAQGLTARKALTGLSLVDPKTSTAPAGPLIPDGASDAFWDWIDTNSAAIAAMAPELLKLSITSKLEELGMTADCLPLLKALRPLR